MLPLTLRLCSLSNSRIKFLVKDYQKVKYVKETLSSVVTIRGKKDQSSLHNLLKPVSVTPSNTDDIRAGDVVKKFNKKDLIKLLNTFFQKPETTALAQENGLDGLFFSVEMFLCSC